MNKRFKNTIKPIFIAIKNGDLVKKIFCLGLIKLGFSNHKLQAYEIRNKNYLYMKKKYKSVLDERHGSSPINDSSEKVIWVLWLQGIENAPDIVKICYKSIIKFSCDYKVVLIDNDNLFNYISLPDYIVKKWKNGIITNTHFSDIVRTELLIEHGGIWLDATTFLTDNLPSYILDSDFFIYKRGATRDITSIANSWLITANKNAQLLMAVRELLFAYWKKENKLRDYFLWHLCMTIAIEEYPDIWNNVLFIPDALPETLRWNIMKTFNEEQYKQIITMTPIHKLTYKIKIENKADNTFYDYILEQKV
jgi:hypothetical protein